MSLVVGRRWSSEIMKNIKFFILNYHMLFNVVVGTVMYSGPKKAYGCSRDKNVRALSTFILGALESENYPGDHCSSKSPNN